MNSTGLHDFLARISPQLDRAVRQFQTHPSHQFAIQSARTFCSQLVVDAEQLGLERTQVLAQSIERLFVELDADPERLTPEVCGVAFEIFDELKELLVGVQATGAEFRQTPRQLLDSVAAVTGRLARPVVDFNAEPLSSRISALTDDEFNRIRDSWGDIAGRADEFSAHFFGCLKSSASRRLLPDVVDEDLQRQLVQGAAVAVRFMDSPDRFDGFLTQVAERTGLNRLPRYELQTVSGIFEQSIEHVLGEVDAATLAAWERLLELIVSLCLGQTDGVQDLKQAG